MAAAKTLFSSVYFIGTTCFDECFLFYVITVRHYFLWKINVTLISIFPDYTILSSLLRRHSIQNIQQNEKLKAKNTETHKTKTQKDENLVLPKEKVENADFSINPYWTK